MNNCYGCNETIKASEKAICSQAACAKQYHVACVNMSAKSFKKVKSWVCPLCVSKQPKGDNSSTPVKLSLILPAEDSERGNVTIRKGTPTPTSPHEGTDIPQAPTLHEVNSEGRVSMTRFIKQEVTKVIKDAIEAQFKTLNDRLAGLEVSVNYLSGQCDDMFKFYSTTKADIAILCDENKQLREELNSVKLRTKMLEDAQARQEQWSRAQNIEVVGVPETNDESTADIIIKIAAQAGVIVQSGDIEFAHRVQPRRPASSTGGAGPLSRAIIARFRQRATKDAIVAAARKHRHITSKKLGMGMNEK